MTCEIKVNDCPVVISVGHVTATMEVYPPITGTRFIAECSSMEEVSEVINNPDNAPLPGWYWDIQFQDKPPKVKKCNCPIGTCDQSWSASDEVGLDCKAVYPLAT